MTLAERNKLRWADPAERARMLAVLHRARNKPMTEFDKAVWRARLTRAKRSCSKQSNSNKAG